MTAQEEKEWKEMMSDALYPIIKKRFVSEIVPFIQSEVVGTVNRFMDMPLRVNQVAEIMHVNVDTVYQWKRRGKLVFSGKKPLIITLQELKVQLAGKKNADMLELLENKSSKVKSGDSAGEAISEQQHLNDIHI